MDVTVGSVGAPDATGLLAWYDRAGRTLPWRAKPGEPIDPYLVWLSEVMLQQTTVVVVAGYFERFVARWPTVEALAAAALDDVLAAWAGLGYYARARNLKACAEQVAAEYGGRFPGDVDSLRALPGIGPYTASAIAAIAFEQPVAAVDGNVERVIARIHALQTPLPALKREIGPLAQALVPPARPGDFAQAMMDLGATVCTPRNPSCGRCPWQRCCRARACGLETDLPRRPARRPKPVRSGVAFWLERADGRVLLRRRPARGLLGGMLEVPSTPWRGDGDPVGLAEAEAHAPGDFDWRALAGDVRHTFTHFHLQLAVRTAKAETAAALGPAYEADQVIWADKRDLGDLALPSVMRKVAAHAMAEAGLAD